MSPPRTAIVGRSERTRSRAAAPAARSTSRSSRASRTSAPPARRTIALAEAAGIAFSIDPAVAEAALPSPAVATSPARWTLRGALARRLPAVKEFADALRWQRSRIATAAEIFEREQIDLLGLAGDLV